MPRSRNLRPRRRRRWDPSIFTVENVSLTAADTASNNTILTIGNPAQPYSFRLKECHVQVLSGATAAMNLFCIRRVPQGYSNPSITVATGTSTLIDTANVIAYGMILANAVASSTSEQEVELTILKPTITLFEGDTVIIQAVPNSSSTGQTYSVFGAYSIATL